MITGAPIPDFDAIVTMIAYEHLEDLGAALARAQTKLMKRIAEEASGRGQRRSTEPAEWVRTTVAAARAGLLDLGPEESEATRKKKVKAAQQTIAHWARGQSWASRPSRKVLLVNLPVFLRWLTLRGKLADPVGKR